MISKSPWKEKEKENGGKKMDGRKDRAGLGEPFGYLDRQNLP